MALLFNILEHHERALFQTVTNIVPETESPLPNSKDTIGQHGRAGWGFLQEARWLKRVRTGISALLKLQLYTLSAKGPSAVKGFTDGSRCGHRLVKGKAKTCLAGLTLLKC